MWSRKSCGNPKSEKNEKLQLHQDELHRKQRQQPVAHRSMGAVAAVFLGNEEEGMNHLVQESLLQKTEAGEAYAKRGAKNLTIVEQGG